MATKIHSLQEENKNLKNKIQVLEKEVQKLKSSNRPSSAKRTKSPDEINKFGFSRNKNKFDESSIEKNNSKESWSKLINTDLEILKELRSPVNKNTDKPKAANEQSPIEIEPKLILSELNTLKEENKFLKMQLKKRNYKTPRSESRVSKKNDIDLNETNKNSRTKHCKVCAKLLSKGYTTRFCPIHGHSFKTLNKSYLT